MQLARRKDVSKGGQNQNDGAEGAEAWHIRPYTRREELDNLENRFSRVDLGVNEGNAVDCLQFCAICCWMLLRPAQNVQVTLIVEPAKVQGSG